MNNSVIMQDFIDGFTKGARAVGRPFHIQDESGALTSFPAESYAAGKTAALQKYAALSMHDGLDLAGLGMMAVPTLHSVVFGGDDSPAMKQGKRIADLAGLATLAASTLTKVH